MLTINKQRAVVLGGRLKRMVKENGYFILALKMLLIRGYLESIDDRSPDVTFTLLVMFFYCW